MAYTYKHGDRPVEGYTIQRAVGRGGFGEVYYAVSDGGKEVALKYLRDNPAVELRGVSHCLNLKDPHLVALYDVRENRDGEHFVIMEYVAGPSLRDLLLAEPSGLGVQKAAFFLREIGKGLSCLHQRGIVHRDLKPGNIFFEDGRVKIGDYGLAKFISTSRHSVQTASVGTVHYMAPEISTGTYSQSVDVYALGVILYEMLLGRVPFDGATMGEVLMKHLASQPEVEALPAPFSEVIRKALAKDPKDRFASVEEMVRAVFAEPGMEASVAGFDAVSLRELAAEVEKKGVRIGASHDGPPPVPVAVSPRTPAPDASSGDRNDSQPQVTMAFVLAFSVLVISCLLVVTGNAVFGVGLLAVGWGYIYRRKDRQRRVDAGIGDAAAAVAATGPRIEMPIRRSFVTARRDDLEQVLTRYFVSLGWTPAEAKELRDALLWVFRNDTWEEYCVARVAAFEVPDGYHVSCIAEVEDPDDPSDALRRRISREVDGLEQLFRDLEGSRAGSPVAAVGADRPEPA